MQHCEREGSMLGEFIGMLAGILTTAAFFPQVVKTVRTKSTGDLSAAWLIMMTTGVFLWIIYGIYLGSMPVIAANIVTLGCLGVLAWVKFFRSISKNNDRGIKECNK